ncbi:peptidase M28 family protein [Actinidia rufa]|uniref:Peptidase M28 family protein n=1 Tax=Actinidia rufa TaxID=165716 RepID=A0A7J0GEP8_9ERIC|nr:peptidase M28 family protein [Actinidia rufa]
MHPPLRHPPLHSWTLYPPPPPPPPPPNPHPNFPKCPPLPPPLPLLRYQLHTLLLPPRPHTPPPPRRHPTGRPDRRLRPIPLPNPRPRHTHKCLQCPSSLILRAPPCRHTLATAPPRTFSLAESGASGKNVVRPYHAYSPSGAAYGRAVFVNYGREEDYRALAARGIRVAGCVAVARRGAALSRNSVVEGAAEKGMAAVLLYTEVAEGFGDGVERGTVMRGLGDPLSPGWAGAEGGERLGLEDSDVVRRFPKIPSMPISADAAEGILRSLEGARVPYEWRDILKAKVGRVGPGPTMLNFTYQAPRALGSTVVRGGARILEKKIVQTFGTQFWTHYSHKGWDLGGGSDRCTSFGIHLLRGGLICGVKRIDSADLPNISFGITPV